MNETIEIEKDAFSDRLKLLIGNESRRSFAGRIGVSPSVLGQYVTGKSEPTRPVLIAITRTTGANIGWLLTGEGEMMPAPAARYHRLDDDHAVAAAVMLTIDDLISLEMKSLSPVLIKQIFIQRLNEMIEASVKDDVNELFSRITAKKGDD